MRSLGGIIGYAAAAKRGVQDTDSDISPTAASSSTSSHFNEKGGAKRPPIKKSLSHESGTRTLTSSLVTSSALVSAMSGLDSHKMPSIPLQISPTTVTARSSPSIPIPASSTTVSNGAPTTPVRVSTTATDSSGEKGFSKAGERPYYTCEWMYDRLFLRAVLCSTCRPYVPHCSSRS